MPNIKSAKKRVKINKRNQMRNNQFKSMMKTSIKKIDSLEGAEKGAALREALSNIDRSVNKGILKRNTADRKKSSVMRKYNKAV